MSTPHNTARKGDFAKTVLMPGDPLRAKLIADNYLENARLVNNVRGIQGYTGTWKGKPVSVMAHGMGIPSIGIYSYELYNMYDVDTIIRVGSVGSIQPDIKLRSVMAAMSAYSDSNYGKQFGFDGTLAPCANFDLLCSAASAAKDRGMELHVGPVFSSDIFYGTDPEKTQSILRDLGVMGIEMEAYALYLNAAKAKKNALVLLTVSDELCTGARLKAEERQTAFGEMIELALDIA